MEFKPLESRMRDRGQRRVTDTAGARPPSGPADERGRPTSAPTVAGDIVFFTTTTTGLSASCSDATTKIYAFTYVGSSAYDTDGDGKLAANESPLITTSVGRGTAPFIVDQHLFLSSTSLLGTGVTVLGDPEDFKTALDRLCAFRGRGERSDGWQAPAVVLSLLAWLTSPPSGLADVAQREALRRQATPRSVASLTNLGLPQEPPPVAAVTLPVTEAPPPVAAPPGAAAAPPAPEPERHDEKVSARITAVRTPSARPGDAATPCVAHQRCRPTWPASTIPSSRRARTDLGKALGELTASRSR
jgi:hypothetical protein